MDYDYTKIDEQKETSLFDRIVNFLSKIFETNDVVADKYDNILGVISDVKRDIFTNICITDFLKEKLNSSNNVTLNDLIFMSFTENDDLEFIKNASDKERLKYYLDNLDKRTDFTFYDLQIAGILLQGKGVYVRTSGKYLVYGDSVML